MNRVKRKFQFKIHPSFSRQRFPSGIFSVNRQTIIFWIVGCLREGPVMRATFSCNLSRNNVAVASCDCLLRVLPPPRATNFYVAESKSDIYFLQHENLLREMVVIRATNNLNLQRQHCCATSCAKMLPVLLGLK